MASNGHSPWPNRFQGSIWEKSRDLSPYSTHIPADPSDVSSSARVSPASMRAIAAATERLEISPTRDLYSTRVIFWWDLTGYRNSKAYLPEGFAFLDCGTYSPLALASSRLRASRALFRALSSFKGGYAQNWGS